MKTPKVLTGSDPYNDPELSTRALTIVTKMTGNPHFTTPKPALADVSTAIDDFDSSMTEAATGDHAAVELKNQKRKNLSQLLSDLGIYVQLTSNGDAAIMLSSGFKISKEPTPVGPLPKPTGFFALPQGKGEMLVGLDRIPGARMYQYEYKEPSAAGWTLLTNSKSKVLMTGLTSGKEYLFRVLPLGASDIREYSDEVSSFVI